MRPSGSPGDSGPGPRLGEIVTERLAELGVAAEEAQWDSRKRGDNSWQVQLMFTVSGRPLMAEWVFDPRRRHVTPADDDAARLSLPEADSGRAGARTPGPGPGYGHSHRQPAGGRAAAAAGTRGPSRAGPSRWQTRSRGEPGAHGRKHGPKHGPRKHGPPEHGRRARPSAQPAQVAAAHSPHGRGDPPGHAAEARPAAELAEAAPDADSQETAVPQRGRARKAAGGRSRRSSVPSWDEIMFGTSRQPE